MAGEKEIISNVLRFVEEKKKCFNEILNLTYTQKNDIENNEGENLIALINEKQGLIDKINVIDREFIAQFTLLKKNLNVKSLEEIDAVKYPELILLKNSVEQIIKLENTILSIEKENNEKANIILENIKKELKNINMGKASLKSYNRALVQYDGIYIDKKK